SFRLSAKSRRVEEPKTAIRDNFGIVSFRSSRRLPLSSGARVDSPVMFPPGRARLATNPLKTGSPSWAMTIGIVEVATLAGRVAPSPPVTITSTLETHELDGERLRALAIAIRSAPFYSDIFSFDISQIAQSLTKSVGAS